MAPGDRSIDAAFADAYEELRAIAHRRLAGGGKGRTLSTTALVHEAWLKLARNSSRAPGDQQHLLAVASLAMRHVIVDRAREREALKRGGVQHSVTFDDEHAGETIADTILHLNDALEQLAASEPRLAQVVECRFFGGLTEAETAQALDVTVRTVQRDWAKARELLLRALQ